MPRGRYTPQQMADALACLDANAGNVRQTARQLHIPQTTLAGWAARPELRIPQAPPELEIREARAEKARSLADAFEGLAWRLLEGVSEEQIERASVTQRVLGAAIAVDKMLALRGQPGSIVEHRDADLMARSFGELEAMLVTAEGPRALPAPVDGDTVAFPAREAPESPGDVIE